MRTERGKSRCAASLRVISYQATLVVKACHGLGGKKKKSPFILDSKSQASPLGVPGSCIQTADVPVLGVLGGAVADLLQRKKRQKNKTI